MTAVAHTHAAFEIRAPAGSRTQDRLSLRATEDGWSLIAEDGGVIFRASGIGGRRRCLEAARELGVLAVFS